MNANIMRVFWLSNLKSFGLSHAAETMLTYEGEIGRPGEEGVGIEEMVTPNAPRELLHGPHRTHSVKP